ncbi:hypothetical protein NKG94_03595 [Micromonospora sp. M12]
MTRVTLPAPVISAWSAVSPFGIGVDDFAVGLRSGRRVLSAPGTSTACRRARPWRWCRTSSNARCSAVVAPEGWTG